MKKIKNKRMALAMIMFIILNVNFLNAQIERYYAAFMYQFTNYIEWPNKYSEFVIGVAGNSSIVPQLQQLAAEKKVGNIPIVIKVWNNIDDIGQCNIIFVPESQNGNLQAILNKVENKPILVVTESPNLIKNGANISFVKVEGKLKFELNKTSSTKMGLNILSALERFALNVY